MTELGYGAWSYIFLFIAGFGATQPWRYLGVILSRNVHEDAEILVWVRAVSTALVAGLVARMVLLPAGALADVPPGVRLGAFAFGVAAFFLSGRKLIVGVSCAAIALVLTQHILAT